MRETESKRSLKKNKDDVCNPLIYKRNPSRRSKVSCYGEITKLPRSTRSPCRCSKKCCDQFDENDKVKVFAVIHGKNSKDKQDLHLQRMIEVEEVKERRGKKEENEREVSYKYHILLGDKKIKVCREAFLKLYDISARRVRRIKELLLEDVRIEIKEKKVELAESGDKTHEENGMTSIPGDFVTVKEEISKDNSKLDNQCSVCRRSFSRKYTLQMHILTHETTSAFICSICKRSFKRKTDLTKHMHYHKSKEDFSCDVCDKKFKYKDLLRSHQKNVHATLELLRCEICSKILSTPSGMKRHLSNHSNELDHYECHYCHQRFLWKDTLRRHMKNHLPRLQA